MTEAQEHELEYLESVEFPTPFEFDRLRLLWALKSEERQKQETEGES